MTEARLIDGKFPEVKLNGHWGPICGPWFWDNNYGASLFCKLLNSKYTSGTVKRRPDIPLKSRGLMIGICSSTDKDLAKCTGGNNKISDDDLWYCAPNHKASVEIHCKGKFNCLLLIQKILPMLTLLSSVH